MATRFRAGTLHYSLWGLLAVTGWLLVGELGIAMRDRWAQPIGLVVLRNVGASDTSIALLLSTVPAVISLLLVPAIGLRSDRCRSPWGRRRPYLLVSAPLGAIAMLCVAAAPTLAAFCHGLLGAWSPGQRALDLGFFCLFWTVFEAAAMTTVALFNGLVNDVMPHGLLGRLYAVLRILGLGVAIFFNMSLFALADTRLFELLLSIALVFGLSIPLMCLMVREGAYATPAPAPAPAHAAHAAHAAHTPRILARAPARTQLLQCCAQRRHLWAFGAFMLAAVTFSPFNTFSQNYALGLGLTKAELGALTATGYAVSIAGAFGIGWLADRFGAVRVATAMMALYSLIAVGGWLLVRDGSAFRAFYLAHVIVSGAYFTAAAAMPMDVFPRAEFVRYNASKDIMVALANILVGTCLGPLLDLSGHDYRLTLASAALFSLLCLGCLGRLPGRAAAAEPEPAPACTLP